MIFDIKRFAVHDGPGIRTTIFFKGCPLHCLWCHNPEGIDSRPELMPFPSRCSKSCRDCLATAPRGALSKRGGRLAIDRARLCPADFARPADACLYDALKVIGRKVSIEELVAEVEKDALFYEQSGGGVTFSGGEPLLQHAFVSELADALRARKFRTALDTSGLAAWTVLEGVARKVDLVLYDLKMMDDAKHRLYTGVSNRLILENLRRLAGTGREIWVRIPLVPGVNDDADNLRRTAEFLAPLDNVKRVSVLPYHKGGCAKSENLGKGRAFRCYEPPAAALVDAFVADLSGRGLPARIGG